MIFLSSGLDLTNINIFRIHDPNKLHDTIKFTHEISDAELTFLDVTLYKGYRFQSQSVLDIQIHIKPTNKQLYVHGSPYHPPSILAAISKGETLYRCL